MSIFSNNRISNFVNNKSVRNFASKLCTPKALLPVVVLESTVLVGRTYQAKKRGGDIEARERLTEEAISSVIWLWGMGFLNKCFDFLIDKVGKVKEKTGVKDFNFDTGRDKVRQPFDYVSKGLSPVKKRLIAGLKFSKIAASAAIAVGFMGIVLPKINQNITKDIMKKQGQDNNQAVSVKVANKSKSQKKMDINEFLTTSRGSAGDPSFGGGTFFETAAHQLENNNVTQLLTIDAGLFTGRAVNARNKHERNEILFRDLSSSFFYVAATPLIYKGLCSVDSLGGKNTQLSPDIAHNLHEKLTGLLKGQEHMPNADFVREVFGTKQVSDEVFTKAGHIFEEDIVSVNRMHKFINENVLDTNLATSLREKASQLSKLQPTKEGSNGILTRSQLTNLFHDGLLNEPDVINKLVNDATGGVAMNPIKFIPQKQVDKERNNIVNYAESILDQAKKEGLDKISTEFLQKMKNRNLITKFGYWGAGMAVSGYFLSTAIPKMQYHMTQKVTGANEFPGIKKYEYQN